MGCNVLVSLSKTQLDFNSKYLWAKAVVSMYLKKELKKKERFFLYWHCCSAGFFSMLVGFDWTGFDNVRVWWHKWVKFLLSLLQQSIAWMWEWCQSLFKAELLKFSALSLVMVSLIWEHMSFCFCCCYLCSVQEEEEDRPVDGGAKSKLEKRCWEETGNIIKERESERGSLAWRNLVIG